MEKIENKQPVNLEQEESNSTKEKILLLSLQIPNPILRRRGTQNDFPCR